jgi:hypothetical protein
LITQNTNLQVAPKAINNITTPIARPQEKDANQKQEQPSGQKEDGLYRI